MPLSVQVATLVATAQGTGRRVTGRRADALMNCVVHMHDPEGSMRCSGVNGGFTDDHVRWVAILSTEVHPYLCALSTASSADHDGVYSTGVRGYVRLCVG